MATSITEFIAYLQTLPKDTELFVVVCSDDVCSYHTSEVPLDLSENVDFVDLSDNPFVKKGDERYGKKYLTIGLE